MTEKKCISNELLDVTPQEHPSPTCEEGGDAKPLDDVDVSNCTEMTCGENADGFFITLPSQEPKEPPSLQALLDALTEPHSLGGRPPKLTADLKRKVCKLLCLGISRRQAAIIMDIDQATITHAAERDPDFGRALVRAEEFSSLGPKMAIAAAGLRDWRAAAWLLTHQQTHPRQPTPQEREEEHQRDLERYRRNSDLMEADDILSEQREAARRERVKARKRQREAEEQAEFEAENPHLFRRKKKKQPTHGADKANAGHG